MKDEGKKKDANLVNDGIKLLKPDGRMSMDNMIAASHLLSMDQNGRIMVLSRYPEIVRNYVEQVVKTHSVEENLVALNKMIVERVDKEATYIEEKILKDIEHSQQHFEIGLAFPEEYRKQYAKPIAEALVNLGFEYKSVFYDAWHEDLFNGLLTKRVAFSVYHYLCDYVVVLLAPVYHEKSNDRIEWNMVRDLITYEPKNKLLLLSIDSRAGNCMTNLDTSRYVPTDISDMKPSDVANLIAGQYRVAKLLNKFIFHRK